MLPSERRSERLLALVICGAFTLNYPLMSLFSDASVLLGIPVLYLYLFLVWSGFIFLVALVMATKRNKEPVIDDNGKTPQD